MHGDLLSKADPLPPASPTGASTTANVIGTPLPHDSALLHVTGEALYCDDIPLPATALHAAFGLSDLM